MNIDTNAKTMIHNLPIHQWMRHNVRQLIPHKMSICGLATISTLGISIFHTETIDMPSGYFDSATRLFPLGCPVLSRWLLARTPQFIESGKTLDQGIADMFSEFGMQNLLLHGHYSPDSGYVSFFCLYQVSDPDISSYRKCIDSLAESVHHNLMSCLPKTSDSLNEHLSLTNAEHEVFKWLKLGKTNWEIGKILGKSQWTVKTQVQHILRKMDVHSRHELRDSQHLSTAHIARRTRPEQPMI